VGDDGFFHDLYGHVGVVTDALLPADAKEIVVDAAAFTFGALHKEPLFAPVAP
jgi:hypothetical protein